MVATQLQFTTVFMVACVRAAVPVSTHPGSGVNTFWLLHFSIPC